MSGTAGGLMHRHGSDAAPTQRGVERYIPLVAAAGLLGLLVSLYLLSDYAAPLLHIVQDILRQLH